VSEDLDYWREFYGSAGAPAFPSQFAIFVQSWMLGKRLNIVEFGCGNGRDATFFHANGHSVTVTDQVVSPPLVVLAASSDRFSSFEGDVTQTSASVWDGFEHSADEPTVVYSRFFQHSISDEIEDQMLQNLGTHMPAGGAAFFEFRLDQDKDRHKAIGGHYRRFQSSADFQAKLATAGLRVDMAVEGEGYARYGSEDPWVGRFVATKER